AAAALRDEGFRGQVVIISPHPGVPFGRPPLSKTYLRSEEELTDWYVRPADWYEAHDVTRVSSSVAAIDAAADTLVLDSGRGLKYKQILIATGGRNRRHSLPRAGPPGLHYPRTSADRGAIKREARA